MGRVVALVAAVLVAALGLGAASHAAVSEVVDWETGNASQTTGLECPSAARDFSLSTAIVRQGAYAAHLHLDAGSVLWSNGMPRCLVTLYNSGESTGDDYYYGFSIYEPAHFTSLVWELHQPASIYNLSAICSMAPIALHAEHWGSMHGLYLRIATGDCDPKAAQMPHNELNIPLPSLNPEPTNTWIDFVVHVKFAEGATGVVQLWDRTGTSPYRLEVQRTGIPTTIFCSLCHVHDVHLYTEAGLYTNPTKRPVDLYLDSFRRGASLADVAPGPAVVRRAAARQGR